MAGSNAPGAFLDLTKKVNMATKQDDNWQAPPPSPLYPPSISSLALSHPMSGCIR